MTRSAANIGSNATYGTRSQTSGRKGGRRPREIEDKDQFDLTPEDKDKRAKRRERNKQAAARCRKRRMDLMETLQSQVDTLKHENNRKQMIIDQLNQQTQEMMGMLQGHNCQMQPSMMSQQLRHLQQQQQTDKEQERMYKAQIQQSIQLKMENDNSIAEQMLNSDMEPLYKDDLGADRSSPINDPYPITTSSMIINNEDPIMSRAFPPTSSKRAKLNQSPLISESNDRPAFSRPDTLPLVSQYSEITNNLPSLNTPSAGLSYGNNDFSMLNQQTFLTPMTLGPIPVTSNANTPPHGELRQL